MELGTHAGTIQLGHSRVAFMDESKPQLDIVRIDDAGRPTVEQHFAIPSLAGDWERAGWLATDGTTAAGTQAGASAPGTAADRKPALLTTSSTRTPAISSVNLGTGSFTRAVATRGYAAAVVSGASGDTLVTVDRSSRTGLFDGDKEAVSLSRAAATTPRFLTGSPDGRTLFLGRSGSRIVTVLTPEARTVTASQISLPAALPDGLYLTTVDPGSSPYDLIGR